MGGNGKKKILLMLTGLGMLCTGVAITSRGIESGGATVPVHIVAMVEPLRDGDKAVSTLRREDVQVRQGKNRLEVTDWIPARGGQAALQLFILIDETSDTNLGSQLGDLRNFVDAQPSATWVAIGYMRNAGVTIAQNFTTDHAAAAKALRLPLGSLGASDSPYLSLISVLKGWPENKLRRSVIMVTDGIDRLREYSSPIRQRPLPSRARSIAPRQPATLMSPELPQTIPTISEDANLASLTAQRYGVTVNSIYARGVGHAGRSCYEITNGQNGIAKIADETGGESFFLGVQNPVSFKPYLDRLQSILENQYFVVFRAKPGKKAGLQRISITTELPNVEIVAANNVWIPVRASETEN